MDTVLQMFTSASDELQVYLEKILERQLSLKEYNTIRNFGSGMMLEVFERDIYDAKTKIEAADVLGNLSKINRLEHYIQHYNNFLKLKGLNGSIELDKVILEKGNCIDLMLLMSRIEENVNSNSDLELKVKEIIDVLKNRMKP